MSTAASSASDADRHLEELQEEPLAGSATGDAEAEALVTDEEASDGQEAYEGSPAEAVVGPAAAMRAVPSEDEAPPVPAFTRAWSPLLGLDKDMPLWRRCCSENDLAGRPATAARASALREAWEASEVADRRAKGESVDEDELSSTPLLVEPALRLGNIDPFPQGSGENAQSRSSPGEAPQQVQPQLVWMVTPCMFPHLDRSVYLNQQYDD
jgi:hypothetical protein